MTVKKVEIKVDINCGKCNNAILEAVTEIEGVNHISLDEGRAYLPCVGPPPKPPEPPKPPVVPEPQKPPPPAPEPPKHVCKCKPMSPYPPPYCARCDLVSVTTYESGSGCTIV
ncbi:hypothetical protein Bca52824_067548 [Brassica carinata]|uniref:HMA domain-containing protein n=1 Tax=Brassica carinata TaxID=52824 RepID=A0A8X7QMS4_BRACI|nr:hypothetical protein Bca52824_067548 [Brassica carinata]